MDDALGVIQWDTIINLVNLLVFLVVSTCLIFKVSANYSVGICRVLVCCSRTKKPSTVGKALSAGELFRPWTTS